ncbi:hypothetical protein NGA_0485900 [Nannochloropsis gaditana CCMP526]|nr:hypothetical protein NGA_0485900 [Nannochloropsis gaditana CCMP526]EKU22250.1 hypothetical protein NGA_0485900 [Nannochloropsis gaditana CCMP526]|eukprot:XP_005854107.1 hypothetical protein NGA_0485900 [Nannochloropsis gaditana CCMP526]
MPRHRAVLTRLCATGSTSTCSVGNSGQATNSTTIETSGGSI